MTALFVARLEAPSQRLILSVCCIAVGTALASAGEVNLSWTGVAVMMLSELFESIRLVMTQLLLTGLKFHPSEQQPLRRRDVAHLLRGGDECSACRCCISMV